MKRFANERVAGLMERLGLDEDTAIESRLVSKTIESAQSRVEGFNFDMRKRVVEYDDVINKQRETIYAERDKVLHNEDLTETIRSSSTRRSTRSSRPTSSATTRTSGTSTGWPTRSTVMGITRRRNERRRDLGPGHPRSHQRPPARARRRATGCPGQPRSDEADWSTVERMVLLRTIDSLWVEHLTEIDDMRRGIGLRGYAQQDPLNEFRREAYELYEELRSLIRHGVASSIFRVTVTRQPAGPAGRRSCRGRQPGRRSRRAVRGQRASEARHHRRRRRGAARCPAMPTAGTPGSAIVKGALPAAPRDQDARTARRSAGRAGRGEWQRQCRIARWPARRVHAEWRPDRAQRRLLVRFRRQVQEVPRPLRPRSPLT